MNVLVTNSVPLNGGDEALLRGLIEALARRSPGASFGVLCNSPAVTRSLLPDLELDADLEHADRSSEVVPKAVEKVRRVVRGLAPGGWLGVTLDQLTAGPGRRRILERYRWADVVLSAPGGYFHDFYGVEDRLRGLETALDLGKPVFLLGHSIGPFWKKGSIRRVRQVFNRLSGIWVREPISLEHVLACGVRPDLVRLGADVAFLWRQLAPELYRKKEGPPRTIGLSFRAWPLGDTVRARDTVDKAVQLSCWMLNDHPARRLVFLSTCQGVPGYVDDSTLALDIVARLPSALRDRCLVDRTRYAPRALIAELGRCDAFVGMRLHACLLAMLGGTPAMGLAYESKTTGIYGMLGLERYQVDFSEGLETWLSCAGQFFRDYQTISDTLVGRVDRLAAAAAESVEGIAQCLIPAP